MRGIGTRCAGALLLGVLLVAGGAACRRSYVAPPARELPPVAPTDWARPDYGDAPTIRAAEQQCLNKLSPRAVASAFRAVDEVATALLDLCTIGIVNDDPLVWHVWCGSDALFDSGFYLPPEGRSLSCEGQRAGSVFECMGQILERHLLSSEMSAHVGGVEIVSLGSVDHQPINRNGQFARNPCTELQEELGLPSERRWTALDGTSEEGSDIDEGEGTTDAPREVWNERLSWCRAAYSALQLQRGLVSSRGRVKVAAIGAGTDWLDHWSEHHPGRSCPTAPAVSGERQPGQCRDARRVDLFIRVRAEQGEARVEDCSPPATIGRSDSAQALYCYSECQARAAVGRNTEGYRAPTSPTNLLFGQTMGNRAPEGWVVQGVNDQTINLISIRRLFLGE